MPTYNAYAAPSAKAPLEPFTFDPGPLGPEEVEIEVSYCASASLISRCSITIGACPNIPSCPGMR
jgi:hypothetical protein